MNLLRFIYVICSLLWTALVLIQQISWIANGYNVSSFIICVMELLFPYFIYKVITDKDE